MTVTPQQALQRLKEGNARFVQESRTLSRQDQQHIRELAESGQSPFAAVLGCSDSRAPIEHIFDAGFGELFVMRVAGNVAGPTVAGSLQFAVEVLRVPLIVVLGHTGCGAVGAALNSVSLKGPLAELIGSVDTGGHSDPEQAVRHNARAAVESIRGSVPGVVEAEREGTLRVAGALLHIDTGKVEWLEATS